MLYLGKHWTNNLAIWSHWCQCNIFPSWCLCGNVRAWGYLVKRYEGSYWPHNRQANLAIFLHELSPLFWQFTNTTAHHLANTSLDFLVLVKICMIGSSLINMCHWELIMYRFIPNVGFRIFHCSCLSINLWGFWTSDSLIPFSASQYTYLPTYLPTNLPKTIKHGHSNFAQSNYNSYCCSMDIQFCNVLWNAMTNTLNLLILLS